MAKPNDWIQTVQTSAQRAEAVSETKQIQLEFWTSFKKYMEDTSKIRCQKPAPQHWMNHSIGRSGFWLSSIASTFSSDSHASGPEIRVEFILGDTDAKKYFAMLESQRNEIEKEIGEPLIWHNPPETKSCKVYVRKTSNFLDRSEWPLQHEWLRENLERFYKVLAPRVKQLDAAEFPPLMDQPP